MDADGIDAQIELRGDGTIGVSLANELQDFEFARAQAVIPFALERCGRRHRRIENGLAGSHALDGRCEVEIEGALEDVAASA